MNSTICKLCKKQTADKKNSHIISKFLTKSLFDSTYPRHALQVDRTDKPKKIQDTPKEDFILCTSCEQRIEIIETYFAKIIDQVHNYKNKPNSFDLYTLGQQQYLECREIHPTFFKLFVYSLVWRASVSSRFEYQQFFLSPADEENLRVFLDLNLKSEHVTLFKSLNGIKQIPLYHNCLIKPKEKSEFSRGIFSVINISHTSHVLFLTDFAIFFYTDEISIGKVLERFSNKQNEKVIIALGEVLEWKELNQLHLDKRLLENNGS